MVSHFIQEEYGKTAGWRRYAGLAERQKVACCKRRNSIGGNSHNGQPGPGKPVPRLLLVGDCGTGKGSDEAYTWLSENLPSIAEKAGLEGLTFHYFYPDLDGHNRVFMAIWGSEAKTNACRGCWLHVCGQDERLCDKLWPVCTRHWRTGFSGGWSGTASFHHSRLLLAEEEDVPELLKRARSHDNCPLNMIVKGQDGLYSLQWRIIRQGIRNRRSRPWNVLRNRGYCNRFCNGFPGRWLSHLQKRPAGSPRRPLSGAVLQSQSGNSGFGTDWQYRKNAPDRIWNWFKKNKYQGCNSLGACFGPLANLCMNLIKKNAS